MGEFPDTPGASSGQGQSAASGVVIGGVEHIAAILTTAAAGATAVAAQLFATAHEDRRAIIVTNCEASGGDLLYVAFDSSVSASRFYAVLSPLDPPLVIMCGPGATVYVFGAAGTTNYHAVEVSMVRA